MPDASDPQFALLRDADLFDFMGKLARKVLLLAGAEGLDPEDIRNGALTLGMVLIRRGKGPGDAVGMRRWMCTVLKLHAFSEIRKTRGNEPSVDPQKIEEGLAAEDERALRTEQEAVERLLEITRETVAKYPEQAKAVMAPDARIEEGEAKDAAARKRRSRARQFLESTISALVAAAIVFLILRKGGEVPKPGPMVWTDSTLATASRELALRHCASAEWEPCLFGLNEAKRLDPSVEHAPDVQVAWQKATGALRQEALDACKWNRWRECLDGLDVARRYDPAGDDVPLVALARSEAQARLNPGPGRDDPSQNSKAPPRH